MGVVVASALIAVLKRQFSDVERLGARPKIPVSAGFALVFCLKNGLYVLAAGYGHVRQEARIHRDTRHLQPRCEAHTLSWRHEL